MMTILILLVGVPAAFFMFGMLMVPFVILRALLLPGSFEDSDKKCTCKSE